MRARVHLFGLCVREFSSKSNFNQIKSHKIVSIMVTTTKPTKASQAAGVAAATAPPAKPPAKSASPVKIKLERFAAKTSTCETY
jgi:hypothetical protein